MLALEADILIKGMNGPRSVKAADFFRGFYDVDLKTGEIITAIRFAPIRSAAYAKLHQRASHYAIVGAAVALELAGGTIQRARIGLTGATSCAIRLPAVEAALVGKTAADAGAAVQQASVEPSDLNADLHASAEYRQAMIPVFVRRAVERAINRGA